MKAIIRKTKEIVDVISYSGSVDRSCHDFVAYIDQDGEEHRGVGLNYHYDFIEFDTSGFIRETAKEIVAAMYANPNLGYYGVAEHMANIAVTQAQRLSEELFTRNYF